MTKQVDKTQAQTSDKQKNPNETKRKIIVSVVTLIESQKCSTKRKI